MCQVPQRIDTDAFNAKRVRSSHGSSDLSCGFTACLRWLCWKFQSCYLKPKIRNHGIIGYRGADQSFPISIGLMIYQELCPVEPVKHKRNWPTSFCFNWDIRVLVDSSTIYLLNHNVYKYTQRLTSVRIYKKWAEVILSKYTFCWGHENIHKVDPYSAPRTIEAHKYKNAYQPSNINGRPSCQCQLLHHLIMYLRNRW